MVVTNKYFCFIALITGEEMKELSWCFPIRAPDWQKCLHFRTANPSPKPMAPQTNEDNYKQMEIWAICPLTTTICTLHYTWGEAQTLGGRIINSELCVRS